MARFPWRPELVMSPEQTQISQTRKFNWRKLRKFKERKIFKKIFFYIQIKSQTDFLLSKSRVNLDVLRGSLIQL